MDRLYNFSAGPAMLPEAVLKKAQAEMLSYNGCRMYQTSRSNWPCHIKRPPVGGGYEGKYL